MNACSVSTITSKAGRPLVQLDNRLCLGFVRTSFGFVIEVYPVTGGQVWDAPFEVFTVSSDEISELEAEMGGQS